MKNDLDNDVPGVANLDQLIEEITVDAYGYDEQLWAFRQAFEDSISVPCDGFVIGEPVSVVAFEYDGTLPGRSPLPRRPRSSRQLRLRPQSEGCDPSLRGRSSASASWRSVKNLHGLLPWGHIDNRPFLCCTHGFGLCLWRLGRFEQAERVFDRMLWLNPSDSQGVRFLIDEVRSKMAWEPKVSNLDYRLYVSHFFPDHLVSGGS